jgi:hypothetical protein
VVSALIGAKCTPGKHDILLDSLHELVMDKTVIVPPGSVSVPALS